MAARPGRERARVCGCASGTSTSRRRSPTIPEPFEPDADDFAAIEEELRVVAEAICRERDWPGVADAEVCGSCRYRSICPDSAVDAEPMWPAGAVVVTTSGSPLGS